MDRAALVKLYKMIGPSLGMRTYDEVFWNAYSEIEKKKGMGIKELREYQLDKLISLIEYAYLNTKYYRKLFDEYGWKPKDFSSFEDYRKIPIITKQILKDNLELLRGLPVNRCIAVTTGGTTGIPSKIYLDNKYTESIRVAHVWHSFHEGNYYFGDRIAVIRGKVVGDNGYYYDEKERILYCSSMNMTENNMKLYLSKMQELHIRHIRAYPSSAELLAKYIEKTGIRFNEDGNIKTLFTSSENLTPEVSKLIQKNLHVKVLDLYGNSEQIGMIGQCHNGVYHEYMTHSYLEYLDTDDKECKCGEARIIGTGFINKALPLLRYDTGDLLIISNAKECYCGNQQHQIKKIVGRRKKEELIVGSQGNLVNLTAINTHADIFDAVYKLQFVQKEKGKILLNIMPNANYTEVDRRKIFDEFSKRLGKTFVLEIKETDSFEYTTRGKSKLLAQFIDISKEYSE